MSYHITTLLCNTTVKNSLGTDDDPNKLLKASQFQFTSKNESVKLILHINYFKILL